MTFHVVPKFEYKCSNRQTHTENLISPVGFIGVVVIDSFLVIFEPNYS